MPLYDFKCKECGYCFEELCKMDVNTLLCPQCGEVCEKVVQSSHVSFKFKGPGFYATDYGKSKDQDSDE